MPWANLEVAESYAAHVVGAALAQSDPALRRALLLEGYLCASGADRDAVFALVAERLANLPPEREIGAAPHASGLAGAQASAVPTPIEGAAA